MSITQRRKARGATAISYGLVVGLISVVALSSVTTVGDEGKTLFERVSSSLEDVTGGAAAPTPVPTPEGPANTVPPAVTGSASRLATVSVSSGTWEDSPTLNYQWRRDGVDIGGETGTSYQLVQDDVGTTVSVAVTATGGSGSSTVIATLSPVVAVMDCAAAFPNGDIPGLISTGDTFRYNSIVTTGTNECRFSHPRVTSVNGGSTTRTSSANANQWCLDRVGGGSNTYTSEGSGTSTRPNWNGSSWQNTSGPNNYMPLLFCNVP